MANRFFENEWNPLAAPVQGAKALALSLKTKPQAMRTVGINQDMADLDNALRSGLINEAEYAARMTGLGARAKANHDGVQAGSHMTLQSLAEQEYRDEARFANSRAAREGTPFDGGPEENKGPLPSYDDGTKYVPEDQVAMVHKGEMIVPAGRNPYNRVFESNQPSFSAPKTAEDYANNDILRQTGSVYQPPENYQDFLKQNKGVGPIDFGGPTNQNAEYWQREHEWKKAAGAINGQGGGGAFNPQAYYESLVRNNDKFDPNLTYAATQLLQEGIAKDPATAAKMAEQQAGQEMADQRRFTPEMQEMRGRLSPAGQELFDQGRDQEILSRLYPDQFDNRRDENGYIKGSYASRNPILTNEERANGGVKRRKVTKEEAFKSGYRNLIAERLASGQMTDEQAIFALDLLSKDGVVGSNGDVNTISKSGRLLAEAVGLPGKTPPGAYGKGGGEHYYIGDAVRAAGGMASEEGVSRRTSAADKLDKQDPKGNQPSGDPELKWINGIEFVTYPGGGTAMTGRRKDDSGAETKDAPKEDQIERGIAKNPYEYGWDVFVNGKAEFRSADDYYRGRDGKLRKKQTYKDNDGVSFKDVPDGEKTWLPVQDKAEELMNSGRFGGRDIEALQWAIQNPEEPQAQIIINGLSQ